MSEFKLDPTLAADCHFVGDFKLSTLLLRNDSRFPWFILVPKVPGISEVVDLSRDDLISYQIESNLVARALKNIFSPDSLNIASIGNIVRQLHIHHIARFESDVCWPGAVWGEPGAKDYQKEQLDDILEKVRQELGKRLTIPKPSATN